MNSAARKAYERDARLNRWAARVGMALVALLALAVMPTRASVMGRLPTR